MLSQAGQARDLPKPLEALADLALDLRWTWNHCADQLWARVDAEAWARARNPHLILGNLSEQRLEELAGDGDFLRQLEQLTKARRRYLEAPGWWSTQQAGLPRGIAYFSLEFGLSETLPLYDGDAE